MIHEISGKLEKIGELKSIGENSKSLVDFIVDVDGRYPNKLPFQAWGERAEQLLALDEGVQIKVSFNIKGRENNGKHYVNLEAFKIDLQ
jgi:hypothetical protein